MTLLTAADELALLDDPVEQRRFTRFSVERDGTRIGDSSLRISGMHCAACAGIIEQAVAGVGGVLEASVSASAERARVRWDTGRATVAAIVAAIRAAGYDAVPDAALEASEARRKEHRAALWRLFVAAFCAMQVMMLATPSYVAHGDELAPDLRHLLNWSSWLLSLPVLLFSAGPYFSGAWRSLRRRRIGMDVPVALGLAVTFVASAGATFDPGGPFGSEVYFDSLTMFVAFLLAGRLFETRARHRVARTLEALLAGMPESALRLDASGRAEAVSVRRLAAGDLVRVPVGQAFPADGTLVEGQTRADESLLSGEAVPVDKPAGAGVVAGSINLGAPVVVRLERVGADTRLEAIVALMRDAMTQRPALARTADRWAGPFLWAVLALAGGAAVVWSTIDPGRTVWVVVSVLIVTCPCALSLAVPSALLSATSAMARRGVLWQRLDALEVWPRIEHIYLDNTGTLTEDRLQYLGLRRVGAGLGSDDELAAAAAAMARWSSHPLSRALAAAVPDHGHDRAPWRDVQERPGQGLQAADSAGRIWQLGSAAWVGMVQPPANGDALATVWFGCEGRPLLAFDFDEALRDDARATVDALRAARLEVVLLSGDRIDRAERLARRLAVSRVIGDATPESKLAEIAAAQFEGRCVAMVGDGINDAPVLARADLSFAMGQGALVARAQADAVIVSGRMGDLLRSREVALGTLRVVRQNLAWAAAYNLACVPLAMIGALPPWAAGLGMASSSMLVIANSLRLAR
jgi:Cu2+-exporting ATPase